MSNHRSHVQHWHQLNNRNSISMAGTTPGRSRTVVPPLARSSHHKHKTAPSCGCPEVRERSRLIMRRGPLKSCLRRSQVITEERTIQKLSGAQSWLIINWPSGSGNPFVRSLPAPCDCLTHRVISSYLKWGPTRHFKW